MPELAAAVGLAADGGRVALRANDLGRIETRLLGASRRCTGSYTLAGGTLDISGTIPTTSDTNTLELTGATGRYKHARGHVRTTYNAAATRAVETLTITI